MGVSWQEVARAVARALSARAVIVHREVEGQWVCSDWLDPQLPLDRERWAPPSGQDLQALLPQNPGPAGVRTSVVAGLGGVDDAARRDLEPLLPHRLLVEVAPLPLGRLLMWLAGEQPFSEPQIKGTVELVRVIGDRDVSDCGRAAPALVALVGSGGEVRSWAERLSSLGYTSGDMLGRPAEQLLAPGEWERVNTALERSMEPVQLRSVFRHASGALVPLEIVATRGEGMEEGSITFIMGHDRRQERRLSHLRRLEAVERLVSGVAHELNNPLQTVVGNAEMLAGMKLTDAAHRRAQRVLSGARRCREVVDGLLKMRRSRRTVAGLVDMEEVVRRALRVVQDEGAASGVAARLEADLNVAPVRGDANDLQQAVENVLRNAFQAVADQPAPEVQVTLQRVGDSVQVTVDDNGTGMSPQSLERAFEPFFSTRGVGGGKGLGLSVALGIVQDHGGLIELQPLARGTRAVLTVPAASSRSHGTH